MLLQMVDVGCGIGGSSRYISQKFGCQAEGITLSDVQAARANELSSEQGLGQQCHFQVGQYRPRA
jgi:tocopherol O-methyltransferase